jgi:hypothetical protein
MRFCRGLDATESLAEFQRDHQFRQNRTFLPMLPGGAFGVWPPELSTIDDSAAASLYETQRISATQGTTGFAFHPLYRVVGLIGETSLFILSYGGTTFTERDDLRVRPTYRFHPITSGQYGHTTEIEVEPDRPSDQALLRSRGIAWPLYLPQPVLRGLTSQGNPG